MKRMSNMLSHKDVKHGARSGERSDVVETNWGGSGSCRNIPQLDRKLNLGKYLAGGFETSKVVRML